MKYSKSQDKVTFILVIEDLNLYNIKNQYGKNNLKIAFYKYVKLHFTKIKFIVHTVMFLSSKAEA